MSTNWRAPATQRRFDPLVTGIWVSGAIGAVLTVVGAVTVAKWLWHIATGLRG